MHALYKAGIALVILLLVVSCAPPAPPAPTQAPSKPATAPPAAPAVATPSVAAASKPTAVTTSAPTAKIKRGGILIYADTTFPPSADPLFDTNGTNMKEMALFEALLRYEVTDFQKGTQELKPELAESWKQVDPKTIELKLRQGVKFHDGTDFNAEAAKWSLDRMATHPKSLSKRLGENFDKLEVVDPYTLKISYKRPSALQLLNLTVATAGTGSIGPAMVSRKNIETVGEEAVGAGKVVGTGPMKMVDWKRDSEFTLTKFDNYWKMGEDGQKLPYVDGVRYRQITDAAVHLVELRAGSLHVTRSVALSMIATAKADPNLQTVNITWSPNRWFAGFNDQKNPFGTNLKLRQATQYATDREALAKVIGVGAGWPGYYLGWIPAWSGYDESLPHYKFDLAKAQQLVKEAGVENPQLEYLHYLPTTHKQVAEMLQQMWSKIGVKMTLLPAEQAAARDKVKLGEFEFSAWTMAPSPDPAHFERMFTCAGAANWNNYCNKETDKCMIEAQEELDATKRAEKYKTCQKIMYEDAQLSNLFNTAQVYVTRKEVKNLKMQIHSADLQEVWLDK